METRQTGVIRRPTRAAIKLTGSRLTALATAARGTPRVRPVEILRGRLARPEVDRDLTLDALSFRARPPLLRRDAKRASAPSRSPHTAAAGVAGGDERVDRALAARRGGALRGFETGFSGKFVTSGIPSPPSIRPGSERLATPPAATRHPVWASVQLNSRHAQVRAAFASCAQLQLWPSPPFPPLTCSCGTWALAAVPR